MSVSGKKLWNNGKVTHKVTSTSCQTNDASILGPVHFSDSSSTFLDVNSILWLFNPCVDSIKFDATLGGNSNLINLRVNANLFDGTHGWSEWMKFFSKGIQLHWNNWNKSIGKSDYDRFFSIPLKCNNFTISFVKFDKLMLKSIWDKSKELWITDDAADNFVLLSLNWGPSYIAWLTFDNECLEWSVTLMVWYSQHFINWSRHEVALGTPVTMSNFFTMLGDARDLSLTLSVEKDERTLLCTNDENWMSLWPRDVTSIILLGGKFNVLELSLAHWPDWDHVGWGKDSKWIVILVPSKIVDPWGLVAGEFKNCFSLSIFIKKVKKIQIQIFDPIKNSNYWFDEETYLSMILIILFSPQMATRLESGDHADLQLP